MMLQARENIWFWCVFPLLPNSSQACQSEKHMGQYYRLPSEHIRTLFPQGLPWRYQQQVYASVCGIMHCLYNFELSDSISYFSFRVIEYLFISQTVMYVLGEDVQWSLFDGEVSSSRGHLISKENRLQQACNAICILYPLKHVPFSLHVSLWTSLSWKTYPSLFDPSENVFCKPYQIVQMGWRAAERRCLSVTQYITVTHRGGWCCMFLMVRQNTTSLSEKCFCRNAARDRSCLLFFFW